MPFIDFQQVESTSSVKTVSDLTIPASATFAMLQADTQNSRFTLDGVKSPSEGKRLIVGLYPERILIDDLRQIKFCREGGSNGKINIHYGN